MKTLLSLLCFLPLFLCAQDAPTTVTDVVATTDSVAVDTTIYSIADEVPRFPTPCERYDTTAAAKAQCSQVALLNYVNQKVIYPSEAREQNISGMAVIGFIVEQSGFVSGARVMKDPGGNLGLATMRAVYAMAQEVRFRPAIKNGKPVRFNFVLPVRFRLEAPKPYVMVGRDTIYTELTRQPSFTGKDGDLSSYLDEKIKYPASGEDSCRTGQLEVQLLIHPNGRVDVQDVIDYNDLGSDFTFEATSAATGSIGLWSPAEYNGRQVTTAYDVSFTFAPESEKCKATLAAYNEAINTMSEGQQLVRDTLTFSSGLEKMDLAIDQFPRDGRFRIIRGQTRMDNNMLSGACEDLNLAKQIALIDWYDSVLPLLCREETEK